MLPAPVTVPPTVFSLALVLKITPSNSLPSATLPVMLVPIRLPSTRLSVAVEPRSAHPSYSPRSGLCCRGGTADRILCRPQHRDTFLGMGTS